MSIVLSVLEPASSATVLSWPERSRLPPPARSISAPSANPSVKRRLPPATVVVPAKS